MQPLDDIGNPDAPRGSRDWCSALRLQAQVEISDAKTRVSRLRWSLKPFRDEGFYKTLTDQNGQLFISWEQFCQYKRPWGLNLPAEVASAVINENDLNKDLATFAAVVPKTVRVILDPECAAKILRKHLSLEDRQRLSTLLIE